MNDLSGTPTAPLLEVRHLSKNFGPVQALKDLSMTLRPGEVVALAGDNGAGKTTLIKAVSGVYPPSGGEILLDGRPVRFASPQEARDKGIETIYQDLALCDNLDIVQNMFLGHELLQRRFLDPVAGDQMVRPPDIVRPRAPREGGAHRYHLGNLARTPLCEFAREQPAKAPADQRDGLSMARRKVFEARFE